MTEQNLDAKYEREVADTEEAKQLQTVIFNALSAYADYLDRYGLIWDLTKIGGSDPLKVERLIAEIDFRSTDERVGPTFEIILKGGALDTRWLACRDSKSLRTNTLDRH
jgi:hypothetical protein